MSDLEKDKIREMAEKHAGYPSKAVPDVMMPEDELLPMEVGTIEGFRIVVDSYPDMDESCQSGERGDDFRRERNRSGTKPKKNPRYIRKLIAKASRKLNRRVK